MEEPQQTSQTDEEVTLVVSGEEATLVSPRFDDEETLVARPVVPLDGEAVEEPAAVMAAAPLAPPPARARRGYAPRRSWVLALVLVSVLVGGVLGGAGLYLYQRQSQDDFGATAGATTQSEPPTETQQPASAATENVPPTEAQTPAESPATDAPTVDVQPAEPAAADSAADVGTADDSAATAAPAREPKTTPAVERRDGADAGESNSTRKRGKKGEHDDDDNGDRSGRRRSRPDADVPVARDDSGARESRRVDSIVYRPRRAPRRERIRRDTAGDTDRLRRIFEGAPE